MSAESLDQAPHHKPQPRRRSIGKFLLIAAAVWLVSTVVFLGFFVSSKARRVHTRPAPDSPLIGTWKRDDGSIVNYRPDGTARYRGSLNGVPNQILYFEWMIDDSNHLVIHHVCSNQSAAWKSHLGSWIAGNDGFDSRHELVEVSPSSFSMRSADGDEVRFVPAQDSVMESAP